jgi:hypothetical protein
MRHDDNLKARRQQVIFFTLNVILITFVVWCML